MRTLQSMQQRVKRSATPETVTDDVAECYTQRLLTDLGASSSPAPGYHTSDAAARWRECGLAELTGTPDTPLTHCPLPLAAQADDALNALRYLSGRPLFEHLNGAELLTLRASMAGLSRQGGTSPGGSCRILACADGHIALNLARDCDWELIPAWLRQSVEMRWSTVEKAVRAQPVSTLLLQGRLLGLAIADAKPAPAAARHWFELSATGPGADAQGPGPRVIDLSSLWAGPLCGLLLQRAGAEVVKVESSGRPDGARFGPGDFFEFLNAGKQQLQLDLCNPAGRKILRELILGADIVIESSRPRALRQMGFIAERLLQEKPGLTWISITGYGRQEPEANWVAYGDDAGVAAGLSQILQRETGRWLICGDAIADPLTGIHAALAALASWRAGGGRLLSLSLVQTVRHCIAAAAPSRGTCLS